MKERQNILQCSDSLQAGLSSLGWTCADLRLFCCSRRSATPM